MGTVLALAECLGVPSICFSYPVGRYVTFGLSIALHMSAVNALV